MLATTEGATDAEKELVNKKENKSDEEKDFNNDKNEELNFVYVQGGPTKEEGVEIKSTEINSKKIMSMENASEEIDSMVDIFTGVEV